MTSERHQPLNDLPHLTPESQAHSLATIDLFSGTSKANLTQIVDALSRGANPHARNLLGYTPLMDLYAALRTLHSPDLDARLVACADALTPHSDLLAIQYDLLNKSLLAIASNCARARQALVAALIRAGGSDLNLKPGTFTGLMTAAFLDDAATLRLLLPVSHLDAQSIRGSTALILACCRGAERCFDILLPLSNLDLCDDLHLNALQVCQSMTTPLSVRMGQRLRVEMDARELARLIPPGAPSRLLHRL